MRSLRSQSGLMDHNLVRLKEVVQIKLTNGLVLWTSCMKLTQHSTIDEEKRSGSGLTGLSSQVFASEGFNDQVVVKTTFFFTLYSKKLVNTVAEMTTEHAGDDQGRTCVIQRFRVLLKFPWGNKSNQIKCYNVTITLNLDSDFPVWKRPQFAFEWVKSSGRETGKGSRLKTN